MSNHNHIPKMALRLASRETGDIRSDFEKAVMYLSTNCVMIRAQKHKQNFFVLTDRADTIHTPVTQGVIDRLMSTTQRWEYFIEVIDEGGIRMFKTLTPLEFCILTKSIHEVADVVFKPGEENFIPTESKFESCQNMYDFNAYRSPSIPGWDMVKDSAGGRLALDYFDDYLEVEAFAFRHDLRRVQRQYFRDLSYRLQNPGSKTPIMPIFYSPRIDDAKHLMVNMHASLFGAHNLHIDTHSRFTHKQSTELFGKLVSLIPAVSITSEKQMLAAEELITKPDFSYPWGHLFRGNSRGRRAIGAPNKAPNHVSFVGFCSDATELSGVVDSVNFLVVKGFDGSTVAPTQDVFDRVRKFMTIPASRSLVIHHILETYPITMEYDEARPATDSTGRRDVIAALKVTAKKQEGVKLVRKTGIPTGNFNREWRPDSLRAEWES